MTSDSYSAHSSSFSSAAAQPIPIVEVRKRTADIPPTYHLPQTSQIATASVRPTIQPTTYDHAAYYSHEEHQQNYTATTAAYQKVATDQTVMTNTMLRPEITQATKHIYQTQSAGKSEYEQVEYQPRTMMQGGSVHNVSNLPATSIIQQQPANTQPLHVDQHHVDLQQQYSTQHQQRIISVPQQQHTTNYQYDFNSHYPNLPKDAYQSEVRKISSVILETTPLQSTPAGDEIRYVDVPTTEEQVTYVTVKETREVEKVVKVPQIEWVTREVTKPVIEYVEKYVQVPHYVNKNVTRKEPQIVDREVKVVREIKKPQKRTVVHERKVPGETIEVIRSYPVEEKKTEYVHVDREVPVIVAQTVRPVISESERQVSVDVLDYEPEVVPVDVHVAKPITSALEAVGQVETRHRLVNITSGQYNTILKLLNRHMDEETRNTLPFVSENGRVPFISEQEAQFIVAPPDVVVEGWTGTAVSARPPTVQSRGASVHLTEHSLPATKTSPGCGCGNWNTSRKSQQISSYHTTTTSHLAEEVSAAPSQHHHHHIGHQATNSLQPAPLSQAPLSQTASNHHITTTTTTSDHHHETESHHLSAIAPPMEASKGSKLSRSTTLSFGHQVPPPTKRTICC